jgi:hypothetical protein
MKIVPDLHLSTRLLSALILSISLSCVAAQADEPAQVMLFGTFHFQDAGLDVVKLKDVNVMTAESQEYLQGLAERLASFEPTRVLLEYNPDNEELMNERYQAYLAGEFELPTNEIYQLGFRIAKLAGNTRVYSFDNREIEWQAEALFEYAKENNSPEMDTHNEMMRALTEEGEQARANLSLGELLVRVNNPEQERINMDSYLVTNAIGANDGYSGATASASWWERNFRMYANIQQQATPGQRIIALGGAGHTAILKQLLQIDSRLQGVDVIPYLE